MFAYCLNNPIRFIDRNGKDAALLEYWAKYMWWLCGTDAVLPIGDIVYGGGIAIFGLVALLTSEDSIPYIEIDTNISGAAPSPNNNNDDDDDDYYNDESNFAGRQKIGKSKGKTPGNNQRQNQQFRDATKGIKNKDIRRLIHNEITKKGFGYHDIKDITKFYLFPVVSLFPQDDN